MSLLKLSRHIIVRSFPVLLFQFSFSFLFHFPYLSRLRILYPYAREISFYADFFLSFLNNWLFHSEKFLFFRLQTMQASKKELVSNIKIRIFLFEMRNWKIYFFFFFYVLTLQRTLSICAEYTIRLSKTNVKKWFYQNILLYFVFTFPFLFFVSWP